MKNEEVVALMQAMELKWEQRAESQMTELKLMLEERLSHVVTPTSQMQGGDHSVGREGERSVGRRSDADADSRELHTLVKSLRVKVPRFDGLNVDDWIYKINKFFDLHRVDPVMRLAVVPFHLDGTPSTWFQWMEKGGTIVDWDGFLAELRRRFGTSIYDDPLGKISKLVQTGKVSEFRAEFESLMLRSMVSRKLCISIFFCGDSNRKYGVNYCLRNPLI